MAGKSANMKLISERLERLKAEREALNVRIDELTTMLRLVENKPAPEKEVSPIKRGSIKQAVIDLVTEAAEAGLTVSECIDRARDLKGVEIERATASSLLSRFKKEQLFFFDGTRYRLQQYAGPRQAA